jgi:hypothetical protein
MQSKFKNVKYSGHAVSQMFKRRISKDEVRDVIDNGEIIKEYPDDKPYPGKLMLGFPKKRPLHVVLSYDVENETRHIITSYQPDPKIWNEDFKKKRR